MVAWETEEALALPLAVAATLMELVRHEVRRMMRCEETQCAFPLSTQATVRGCAVVAEAAVVWWARAHPMAHRRHHRMCSVAVASSLLHSPAAEGEEWLGKQFTMDNTLFKMQILQTSGGQARK